MAVKRSTLLDVGDEVSYSCGLTLQVAERNFVKIDVMTKTKVRKGETGDGAFNRLVQFNEKHLNEKAEEYEEALK